MTPVCSLYFDIYPKVSEYIGLLENIAMQEWSMNALIIINLLLYADILNCELNYLHLRLE